MNKKINVCMRSCLRDDQWQDYDLWIRFIVFTMNSLKSTKTKHSANMLVFGREIMAPRDLFLEEDDRIESIRSGITDDDARKIQAYNLYKNISELTRKVVANSEEYANYTKTFYDKHLKGPYFEKGQWCMLLIQPSVHKYAPRFKGPYKIIDKLSNWNYIVQIDGVNKVTNISKMKLYKYNHYSKDIDNKSETDGNLPSKTDQKNGEREEHKVNEDGNLPSLVTGQCSSSSDSDEGYNVIMTRARAKKRAIKSSLRNQAGKNTDFSSGFASKGAGARESSAEDMSSPERGSEGGQVGDFSLGATTIRDSTKDSISEIALSNITYIYRIWKGV